MIRYLDNTDSITPELLKGFFVGWLNPPAPATHLRLLQQSAALGSKPTMARRMPAAFMRRNPSAITALPKPLP